MKTPPGRNLALPNQQILDTIGKEYFTNIFQDSWARSLIKYHPEYTKLKFTEDNLVRTYAWADRVENTSCYQRAVDSNFVNPLTSDPYFNLPNTQADKDTLNRYLFTGISYKTGAPSPSIWQIANSTVACATVDSLAKYACMMRSQNNEKLGLSNLITVSSKKDEVWESFKTIYLSYRNEMVLRYIQNAPGVISRADMNKLLLEGKELIFANNQDVATQNGAGTWWANITNPNNSSIDTTGTGAAAAANAVDNCEGQRIFWKARLKNCEVLNNLLENSNPTDSATANLIITKILDSMVMVCRSSVNAQQPYGSSTLTPNSTAYPKSFESIINNVLQQHGISTLPANYYCNPYTIEFPKPYGSNPPLFVNNSNVLDSCACRRFGLLQTEAAGAGFNANSFASMNLFLNQFYKDSLTLVVWTGLQNCSQMFVDTCMYYKTGNSKNVVTSLKVSEVSKGECTPPQINAITVISGFSFGQYDFQISYTPSATCDACTVYMYDPNNQLQGKVAADCYSNSVFMPVTDTCIKYRFIMVCESRTCGSMTSDTAYHQGCTTTTVTCTKPTISSVIATGYNNSFQVFFQTTPGCDSCQLIMYNGVGTLGTQVGFNSSVCGLTNYTFTNPSYDSCSQYSFSLKCFKNGCFIKNTTSLSYQYAGCPPPPPDTCLVYHPIILPQYAVIPPFLSCGYVKPCITCEKLDQITTEFRIKYSAFNAAPYTGSNITDAQTQQNMLWARFINYRVGFSKNNLDYLQAYLLCHPATGNPPPVNFTALCSFTPPLNSVGTDTIPAPGPCEQTQTQAYYLAEMQLNSIRDSLIAKYDSLYILKCLSAQSLERFSMQYTPKEYHYTLYYYDQAGNLVKTMPPAAVKPNYTAGYLASVIAARSAGTGMVHPTNNEALATQYRYNSLNQVVQQKTPDAGISKFWYDRLGRLVISQNAKQLIEGKYSYTQYDALGRITQVGQKPQTQAMTQVISQDAVVLQAWINNKTNGGLKEQITRTVYDVSYYAADNILSDADPLKHVLKQNNLRNRVSYTQLINLEPANGLEIYAGEHAAASYYSYDIHGNVDTLVQDINAGFMKYKNPSLTDPMVLESESNKSGNRYKKMVYDYDLISGKVNKVAYQPSMTDQFYHRYMYDAENRITAVLTSHDSIYWEEDATYAYYRHGPLSRMVLGKNEVQGVDYAYTIQGWLKGVNSNAVATNPANMASGFDMGLDGIAGSLVARDAYGYSLNYFNGDYKPINTTTNPFVEITNNLPLAGDGVQLGKDLFNGNIRGMMVNIPALAPAGGNGGLLYAYRYDQLNRIKAMNSFTGFDNATNQFTNGNIPAVSDNYKERITYDPNGNIKTYLRNGSQSANGLAMDNLTYQYPRDASGKQLNNRLRYVLDEATTSAYTEDIKSNAPLSIIQSSQLFSENLPEQANDNYKYDAIGNLIADAKENIGNITWSVYGKIQSITKTNGVNIAYTYDASGNRISKTVTGGPAPSTTYYVRDASGNVMSIYGINSSINAGAITQTEISEYGSSRLGVWNLNRNATSIQRVDFTAYSGSFTRGNKIFELSNHLGNVLVTVSDKKLAVDSDGNGVVDFYNADVVTANDYYPFGMQMPGRKYNAPSANYRYGFNGKEMDNSTGEGNLDFGARIYDGRIGKFLSVDPLLIRYPGISTYCYSLNNPIFYTDPEGTTVEPNNIKVIHTVGTNKFKVVADLDIKIQVLNISSTANSDLHLQDYAARVRSNLSTALNQSGTLATRTDLAVLPSKNGTYNVGQTGKIQDQIWEYQVNVKVTVEIISSKDQIKAGSHLIAIVNSFDEIQSRDIEGNPMIKPNGVAVARTSFVSVDEIIRFTGEKTAGHEIVHTLGVSHFWNKKPGDKGSGNLMDYPPYQGGNLTAEQLGKIFSENGLSPYDINSYNKPAGEGISLKEFNKKINQTDTKGKLNENKTTAGAN